MRYAHVMSAGAGLGNWTAAEGVRRYLQPEESLDFRRVDPRDYDLLVIGGGGFLHYGARKFWEAAGKATCRIVLWGLGACEADHDAPSAIRPLPSELFTPLRPRVVLASVRDIWTKELYGLEQATIGYCPTEKVIRDYKREQAVSRGDYVLYAHHPGLVSDAEAEEIPFDVRIDHWEKPSKSLSLHASAKLCVTSRLHGAVISVAFGVPCLVIARDRKLREFCRQWNVPAVSHPGEVAARIRFMEESEVPPELPSANESFAEEVRTILASG